MNLVKRIERLPKPRRSADAMQPLFEAISNSIQATREKYGKSVAKKGKITVHVNTNRKRSGVWATVQDNGVGLDKKHYTAFLETDTDNKIAIGGKGVGRLLWLDCFENIKIETAYKDGAAVRTRSFEFKLAADDQIKGLKEAKVSSSTETGMIIKLSGLRNNGYRQKFPGRPLFLVYHLASHFLPMFIGDHCPNITLECGEKYDFPEAIDTIIKRRKDVPNIKSKKYGDFKLAMMECDKIASSDLKGTHFVHFVAHDRTVKSQLIDGKLGFKFFGEDGRSVFQACIFGQFLDRNVNQERTGFTFSDSVIEDIVNEVCMPRIEEFLEAPLSTHKKKQSRIVSKIVADYPSVEFGSVKELQKYVPLGELHDDAIYGHLARERFRRDQRQVASVRSVFSRLRGDGISIDEFYSTIKEASDAVESAAQRSLAEYVVRRRVVLDFLELLIRKVRDSVTDSSYQREDVLHAFICPLKIATVGKQKRVSSAPSHELWVVDERLTFTQYFSSDVPFSDLVKMHDSNERPDLVIFDRIHGLRQSGNPSRVLLVEFKRPGRKDYNSDENPQHQVQSYVTKLLAGNEVDVDGRPIKLSSENTVFYCYIVADRIGKMNEWTLTWEDTPDGRGKFYEPKNGFKGRVEVVSWDDLIGDARERNSIFFERAGLKPTNFFTDQG